MTATMWKTVWQTVTDAFPQILWRGLLTTLPLTALAFALSMLIAVAVAYIQYAKVPVLSQLARFYIWVIRSTPLLVQLYVVFFGLPSVGVMVSAFPTAVVVIGINAGAYNAETMRGALESVPQGQLEAGSCVGLSYAQTMWHIVLPQAFRTAFPALGNSVISMVKDTSLAANITVTEMLFQTQRIIGRSYQSMALYLEVAFIYLLFSTVLSALQKLGEKKLGGYGIQ